MTGDTMTFIYSLSYQGKVFYIGCAIDIHARYKQHLREGKSKTKNTLFIKDILSKGEFPELNILDRVTCYDSVELERKLIRYFSLAGQPLANHQFVTNPIYMPKNIPEKVTYKDMCNIIKYRQEVYIHQKNQSNQYIKFPDEPF